MKHAWRFIFGCALGIGAGYALTLLLSPRPAPTRPKPITIQPSGDNPTDAPIP